MLPRYYSRRSKSTFSLGAIHRNEKVLERYVRSLNKLCPATFGSVTDYAHASCPDLDKICNPDSSQFIEKNCKNTDKGANGKYVEFSIFGNAPNSYSRPDLHCGYNIKTTHFKRINDMYNAKERLTITNCGTKNNYTSFKNINDNECVMECEHYNKMQKGVIFVFLHEDQSEWTEPIDRLRNKILLMVFLYDLAKLPEDEIAILNSDYAVIRKCIADQTVTQRKQQYLHIHKHGTKNNPDAYALGFTHRFLTKLAGFFADKTVIMKGQSYCLRL